MPGQVRWANEAQTTFLISRFSEYVDIYKNDKKYGPFWAKVKEDWFKLFPLDAGSMFPEKSADELTPDDEAAVGKAIKKLMQQLKDWFRWRVNPAAIVGGRRGRQKSAVTAEIPGRMRQLKPEEMYSKMFYKSKIKPRVDRMAQKDKRDMAKGEKLNLVKKLTREMYDAEEESVKLEVMEKLEERAREMEEAALNDEPTPEQYHRAIQDLPHTITHFLNNLERRTGWAFTVLMGGPDPHLGGEIAVGSCHAGLTPDGSNFGSSFPNFDAHYQAPFTKFLSGIFPESIRNARALLGPDHSDSDDSEDEGKKQDSVTQQGDSLRGLITEKGDRISQSVPVKAAPKTAPLTKVPNAPQSGPNSDRNEVPNINTSLFLPESLPLVPVPSLPGPGWSLNDISGGSNQMTANADWSADGNFWKGLSTSSDNDFNLFSFDPSVLEPNTSIGDFSSSPANQHGLLAFLMEDTGASAGSVANPIQTDNFNFAFSQPSPENHGILAAPTFPLLHFGDAPAAVQTPASDLHSTPSSSVPLSDQPSTNATSQAEHRNATAIPPLSIAEGFGDLFGCQISPAAGPQAPTSNEATQHAFLPPQPLNGFGELFQNQTPLVAGSQAPTSNDVAQRMLHQVAQQVSFPAQPSSIGQVSLPVPPTDLATLSSTISPGRNAPMITPTSQSSPVPADPPLDSQAHQPVDKRRSGRSVIPSKRIVAMNEIGTNVLKGLPQNESAAEKENVDPKGHPEWVTLAVDHLLMRDLGSEWQDCVNAWLELELRLGYGAVTGSKSALPAIDLRPEEWQKWVQKSRNGFRKYDTTPTVSDPAEFGICIMKWWHEMQPAFRKSPHGDKPLPTYTPPDPALWDCLRKGGPNGMVSVMTLAVWWGQSLSARTRWQDDSSENWKEFIMDVQKTISEIARTTIERKKRGAPGGAGNKSKRAKVQNK